MERYWGIVLPISSPETDKESITPKSTSKSVLRSTPTTLISNLPNWPDETVERMEWSEDLFLKGGGGSKGIWYRHLYKKKKERETGVYHIYCNPSQRRGRYDRIFPPTTMISCPVFCTFLWYKYLSSCMVSSYNMTVPDAQKTTSTQNQRRSLTKDIRWAKRRPPSKSTDNPGRDTPPFH